MQAQIQQQFQKTHIQPQLISSPSTGTTIRAHNSCIQMIAHHLTRDYQRYSARYVRDTVESEKELCLRYFAEREAFLKDGKEPPEKFRPLPQTAIGVCFPGHYGAPWCSEMLTKSAVALVVKVGTDPNTGTPTIGFSDYPKSIPLTGPVATRFLEELNTGVLSATTAELIEELQHQDPGTVTSAYVEVKDTREIFSSDSTPRVTRVLLKSTATRTSKRKSKTSHDPNSSESLALVNTRILC